jgi:hypothetical protein
MTSRRDEIYVIGVIPAAQWDSEASSLPCSRDEMLESFAGFHVDLRRVLEVADDVSLWPIYDRERNDRWRQDRAAGRCLPSDASVHGGRRRHVEQRCLINLPRTHHRFRSPAYETQ